MSENTTAQNSEFVEIMTAKAWRPGTGDSISGAVANLRRQDDEYGGHIVVTLRTDTPDGPAYSAVHAFHQVLKKQLADRRPSVGDPLRITYLGKVDGKNQPYHSYLVEDPNEDPDSTGSFDWDAEPGF